MYKVKFTPYRKNIGKIFFRQTKNHELISLDGRYRFYIDEEVEDPDFWVIQGKGARMKETCNVAPENIILLSTEPESVLVYPDSYLKQFGLVHTSQQNTSHRNIRLGQAVLPWFVGYTKGKDGSYNYSLDYDTLQSSETPGKTKLLSVITSDKAFTKGHLDRIRFVEKLKLYFGDRIEVFGRGVNSFDDKWDVLAPYKYHIVIENSSEPFYWTEKISDCFLAETYPFYYGCTNLSDYFPQDSFSAINIHDFPKAVEIIERLMSEDVRNAKKSVLRECKEKVLGEYNMFEYVARLCDTLNPDASKQEVVISPCKSMGSVRNMWNYLFARHYYERQSEKVKQLALCEFFDECGKTLYDKRNTIKLFQFPYNEFVVKKFKKANLIQSIIYTFFRKSKAERAFLNAKMLLSLGIDTPKPIRFQNVYKCGFFTQGYLMTSVTNDKPVKVLLGKEDFDESMAEAFAFYVAELHEKGVLHQDLNSTNILYRVDENGKVHFSLIDINRMRFETEQNKFSVSECLENLTRFTGDMNLFEFVLRKYAEKRNFPVDDIVKNAIKIKRKHDKAWKRRKSFLKMFKKRK